MLSLDFIINPNARRVRRPRLIRALRRRFAGRDVAFYDSPGDLPADPGGDRLVVAVGGDGTINRVLNSDQAEARPLAILPMGTSNDLATNLGIPMRFDRACDLLETGSIKVRDLIQVNGRRIATCGGIGFAVDVATQANRWKASRARLFVQALGPMVYPLAAARRLVGRRKDILATLTVSGVTEQIPLSIAMVSNQSRFGKRFSTSPTARPDDGWVHLAIFRPANGLWDLARTVIQIYRACPERSSGLRQIRSEAFKLETDTSVPFFGDGEVLCVSDHFDVCVKPRALRILVASGAEGVL